MLLAVIAVSANAQFEKNTKYLSASLSGLNLSYSSNEKVTLGVDLFSGYFVEDAWMIYAKAGYDHTRHTDNVSAGLGVRYYFKQNGVYMGTGVQYEHITKNVNNIQLCPEVGYAFFLNKHVTVEPAVYYDMSLNDFADGSKVGFKVGVGVYF